MCATTIVLAFSALKLPRTRSGCYKAPHQFAGLPFTKFAESTALVIGSSQSFTSLTAIVLAPFKLNLPRTRSGCYKAPHPFAGLSSAKFAESIDLVSQSSQSLKSKIAGMGIYSQNCSRRESKTKTDPLSVHGRNSIWTRVNRFSQRKSSFPHPTRCLTLRFFHHLICGQHARRKSTSKCSFNQMLLRVKPNRHRRSNALKPKIRLKRIGLRSHCEIAFSRKWGIPHVHSD